jgi:hypothetical protein
MCLDGLLLLACLLLFLRLFWRLDGFALQPSSQEEGPGAPGCILSSSRAPQRIGRPVVSPPLSPLVQSQPRYAPGARSQAAQEPATGVNSEGFACPNQPCPSFGISEASSQAVVGEGKHAQAEQIHPFGSHACRTPFTRPSQH